MFKVSPTSLQTFIDTPNCVLEDRVHYSTVHIPNLFCDCHLQLIFVFCTVIVRCTETFWSPCTTVTPNCTEQSPSWEANSSSDTQKIPRILCNPKVLPSSRASATRPLPDPRQNRPRPPNRFKIHFNNNLPSMPRSSKWPPSIRFPHQNAIAPLLSPVHATYLTHYLVRHLLTRITSTFTEKYLLTYLLHGTESF